MDADLSKKSNNIRSIYKLRTFSAEDIVRDLNMTPDSAANALNRWQKQGFVSQIRRGMYTVVDPTSEMPVADRYEIGSHVSNSAYIGWHSALEIHGLAHQQYFSIYIGSQSRFNNFTFQEIDYTFCASPLPICEDNGIICPIGSNYCVTNLERTIVDCVDRIDRAGGAEELLHCLEGIRVLDEDKLNTYLALYNKKFLYQKMGYLLELLQEKVQIISPSFIAKCREQGANCVKHLTNDGESTVYVKRWMLYVPTYYFHSQHILV